MSGSRTHVPRPPRTTKNQCGIPRNLKPIFSEAGQVKLTYHESTLLKHLSLRHHQGSPFPFKGQLRVDILKHLLISERSAMDNTPLSKLVTLLGKLGYNWNSERAIFTSKWDQPFQPVYGERKLERPADRNYFHWWYPRELCLPNLSKRGFNDSANRYLRALLSKVSHLAYQGNPRKLGRIVLKTAQSSTTLRLKAIKEILGSKAMLFMSAAKLDRLVNDVGTYLSLMQPDPVRRVYVPKANGTLRPLGVPTVRERVACKMIQMLLKPYLWTAHECGKIEQHGFLPNKSISTAWRSVVGGLKQGKYQYAYEVDFRNYFPSISHSSLDRICDRLGPLSTYLKALLRAPVIHPPHAKDVPPGQPFGVSVPELTGTPQGGVLSPDLANLALLETGIFRDATMHCIYFADDGVIFSNLEQEEFITYLSSKLDSIGVKVSIEKTKLIAVRKPMDRLTYPTWSGRVLRNWGTNQIAYDLVAPFKFLSIIANPLASAKDYELFVQTRSMAGMLKEEGLDPMTPEAIARCEPIRELFTNQEYSTATGEGGNFNPLAFIRDGHVKEDSYLWMNNGMLHPGNILSMGSTITSATYLAKLKGTRLRQRPLVKVVLGEGQRSVRLTRKLNMQL
uniref:RNA-dependent DNA polymerase n=1 Tax=Chytriomyces confervae TaxID=246404 RepID=A0A4P8NWS4_9FUNG|nr:RNA-dependent DNA polymerase [Chytriomyces confervae]QCQ69065.1 RNA-dependent DNA polymerase [Chytriomyces confervae]